mgnify:CR=1 FL=1
MNQLIDEVARLENEIVSAVGRDYCLTDEKDRAYFSTDLSFREREIADFVVQPGETKELAEVVSLAYKSGHNLVARGGGMSYTSGYTPSKKKTILIDMRRMNKILEINEEDMYVTVECGCTWKELFEALSDKGLRTPYFGPLSGKYATIGGALSQNSLFMGSGIHHTVAESALGLQVVLANGDILQTGSGAHKNSNSFYRHFGPDITGIFTADTGAFGVKAVATLRLLQAPKSTAYMSFKFDTLAQCLKAQVEIARLSICSECYGFDPYYNDGFEKQGITFEEGISIVGKVARKGGLRGLGKAAKLAVAGKKILKGVPYSLHMTFDGHNDVVTNEHQEIAAEICLKHAGTEMINSIPTVFRAEPFGGVRTVLLGSEGEIWLPVHGFFPLSRAVEAGAATERFFAENKDLMEKHNIRTSYLTCFSGAEFVIEPSFYWHDELGDFRLDLIESEFAAKWKNIPADLETRQVVLELREKLATLFDDLGACHLQIGKYYDYQGMITNEPMRNVLKGIKSMLDPNGSVNPGSLGLE